VRVTYPKIPAFGMVAGKEAVFRVHIKEVQEKHLPVLDDAFTAEKLDADSAEQYRQRTRTRLERNRKDRITLQKQQYVLQQAVANAEFHIPKELIEAETQGMMDSFAMQLEQSGIREEEYYARLGRKKEDFRKDMQMQAEINSRQQFLLEEVAAAEGLTVGGSEIEEEYRKIASRYDVSVKEVKERLGKKHDELIRKDLVCRKALELLVRCSEEIAFS
jgi:trigger factor